MSEMKMKLGPLTVNVTDRKIVIIFTISIVLQLLFGVTTILNTINSKSIDHEFIIDKNNNFETFNESFRVEKILYQPTTEISSKSKITGFGLESTTGEFQPAFYLNFTIFSSTNEVVKFINCAELDCLMKIEGLNPGTYKLVMNFQGLELDQKYTFQISTDIKNELTTWNNLGGFNFLDLNIPYLLFIGIIWTYFLGYKLFANMRLYISHNKNFFLTILLIIPMLYLFLKDPIISILSDVIGSYNTNFIYGVTTIGAFVVGMGFIVVYSYKRFIKGEKDIIKNFFSINLEEDTLVYSPTYEKLFTFLEDLPIKEFPIRIEKTDEKYELFHNLWSFKNDNDKKKKLTYEYLASYGTWDEEIGVFHLKKYDKFLYTFEYSNFTKLLSYTLLINATIPIDKIIQFILNI